MHLIYIYRKYIAKGKGTEEEDADVSTERTRVLRSSKNEDLLHVENLVKVYQGSHTAVNHLCWGVPVGECFGLLGVNGAGKSSTFRMLTGDTLISSGDAFIDGHSVKNERKHCNKYIGYCPQFDALYDELSPREHLALYARYKVLL
jgi:ABC-type multidrug transport system ATPase subunit